MSVMRIFFDSDSSFIFESFKYWSPFLRSKVHKQIFALVPSFDSPFHLEKLAGCVIRNLKSEASVVDL